MGDLVGVAQLHHSSSGVAAADDGGGVGLGQGLGHSAGALSQHGVLEHAHGAVPNHGLGGLHSLAEQLAGLGANIQAHLVGGNLGRVHDLGGDLGVDGLGERGGNHSVHGQKELYALLLGLLEHVLAVLDLLLVHQGGANLFALGLQEGVSHTAANDEGVHLGQQVLNNAELVRHLGAAQNGHEGTHGVLHSVAQELDFLAHQVAHSGVLDVVGDTGGGAVGAVSGAEGVIDIHLGQAGQLAGEGLQVLGLFLAETGVLQQHHVAVVHSGHSGLGVFAHHGVVIGKDHGLPQQFREANSAGGQAELGLGAVLRLAQVAAQDNLAAVGHQLLDGGQGRHNAVVVGDDAVLHGDVEVNTDQHPLAFYVNVVNSLFAEKAHVQCTPLNEDGGL